MTMTKAHKKFILNKLIPFILREQGRGFMMRGWGMISTKNRYLHPDLERLIKPPVCGTVCCIGGSIEYLKVRKTLGYAGDFEEMGELIGLNEIQANNLFLAPAWPKSFRTKWHAAKTPLARAKVAVSLLKEVAKKGGTVLGYN